MSLTELASKLDSSSKSPTSKGLIYLFSDIINLGPIQCGFKDNSTTPHFNHKFLMGFLRWRRVEINQDTHELANRLDFQQKRMDIRILSARGTGFRENDLSKLLVALGYTHETIEKFADIHRNPGTEFQDFVTQLYDELSDLCFKKHFKIFFQYRSLGKEFVEIELVDDEKLNSIFRRYRVNPLDKKVKSYNRVWTKSNRQRMEEVGMELGIINTTQTAMQTTAEGVTQ
jgi:hypothetical protein